MPNPQKEDDLNQLLLNFISTVSYIFNFLL